MRHRFHKIFWAWDFEKEEQWLAEMSTKGLQLVSVGFCTYIFEEGPVNEYSYRLEFLDNLPSHPKSAEYIRFLEDTGIEHIGSYFRWVYLRKKTSDGEFNLFSNIDSRIKHLQRIFTLLIILLPTELAILLSNIGVLAQGNPLSVLPGIILLALVTLLIAKGAATIWMQIGRLKKQRVINE